MALVTVGGYALPTPSTYVAKTATIVDSARNIAGYTIGTVIRNDVAKVNLTWNFLKPDEWAAILQRFDPKYGGSFYQWVTFLNQTSNLFETRQMYVNDRTSSGMHLLYNASNIPPGRTDLIGLPKGYIGAALNLIEC